MVKSDINNERKVFVDYFINADMQFTGTAKATVAEHLAKAGFCVSLYISEDKNLNEWFKEFTYEQNIVPAFKGKNIILRQLNKAIFLFGAPLIFLLKHRPGKRIVLTGPHEIILMISLLTFTPIRFNWVAYLWDPPGVNADPLKNKSISRMILRFLYRYCIKRADLIVQGVHPIGLSYLKIDAAKTYATTNGVNLDQFDHELNIGTNPYNAKDFNLLYIRIGLVESGLETVLKALGKIRDNIHNIKLNLVGFVENEAGEIILEMADQYGVKDLVCYHGVQPHEELVRFIGHADVCLNPLPAGLHRSECYAMKIFNYMAMGRPIVSSNLHAASEVLKDRKNAFLHPPDDSNYLAEILFEIYERPELAKELGRHAAEDARQYSWSKILAPLINYIKDYQLMDVRGRTRK